MSTTLTCCGITFGDGSSQVTSSVNYICMIACCNFCSGDPVVSYCCCGAISLWKVPTICRTLCLGNRPCFGCGLNDQQIIKFGCSESCFAIVNHVSGGFCYCCCGLAYSCGANQCVYLSTGSVDACGTLSSISCLCNWTCCWTCFCGGVPCNGMGYIGPSTTSRKMWYAPSCSGTQATVIFYTNKNNICGVCCTYLNEMKLCYCTTTQQISLICWCCACENARYVREIFITPDRCYVVSLQVCGCGTCAATDFGVSVKTMTDSTCYLTWTNAAVRCGCPFKSALPATCVWVTSVPGNIYLDPLSPLTYGQDNWMPVWLNTACGCCGGIICNHQTIFAFKPVADACIDVSCNIICTSNNTNCIPYFSNCCGVYYCTNPGPCLQYGTSVIRAFDQGDCVKRYMFQFAYSGPTYSSVRYKYVCFKMCGYQLCPIGYTDTCCEPNYCGNCIFCNGVYCNYCPYAGYTGCQCQNEQFWGCANPHTYTYTGWVDGLSYDYTLRSPSNNIYWTLYPLCYQCGVYYNVGPAAGPYGCHQDYSNQGMSYGSPAWCDNMFGGCGCGVFTSIMKFCQDPTCWTLSCNFRPVTVVCGSHYTQRSTYACQASGLAYSIVPWYTFQPSLFQNGCVVLSASFGSTYYFSGLQIAGPGMCGCAYINPSVRTICNNVADFIGIAQNTATAGSLLCVAVPGMIDRSLFSCRFFSSYPANQKFCLYKCGCTDTFTYLGQGFMTLCAPGSFCGLGACVSSLFINGSYDCNTGRTTNVLCTT